MFDASHGERRLRPRPWHHDYLLMKKVSEAFASLIATHLAGARSLDILDYGCGDQPYKPLFDDIAQTYLAADIAANPSAAVHLDRQGKLPLPNESVDVIISAQVLEHVADVSLYLRECSRVLKPKGVLLLSTHGTWIYHPHPTDFRRWTRPGLEHEVSQSSLHVTDVRACVGPLAYTTQVRLLLLRGLAKKIGRFAEVASAPVFLLGQGLMAFEDAITPEIVLQENACVYALAAHKTQSEHNRS